MEKSKQVVLFYVGRRMNGNKLVHAYTKTVPIPQSNGSFFNASIEEKLMLFKKRLIGVETIGKSVLCIETSTGVKAPYSFATNTVSKEVITLWSTIAISNVGQYEMRKENAVKIDGDVNKLIEAIKKYAPSRKAAAMYALLKLL